jgi:peptidoglycan/LPS O-acetylase OafA/YrhL
MNSFSIDAVLYSLNRAGVPYPPLGFLGALGLATGLAYFSFRFYESLFLALKRRFSRLRPQGSERNLASAVITDTIAGVHP